MPIYIDYTDGEEDIRKLAQFSCRETAATFIKNAWYAGKKHKIHKWRTKHMRYYRTHSKKSQCHVQKKATRKKRCGKCKRVLDVKKFVNLEELYGNGCWLMGQFFPDIHFKNEYSDWCKECLANCEDPSEYYKAKYYEKGRK